VAKQRNRKPARRRDKKGGPGSGRRKPCLFCKDKIEHVDYKDVGTLRRFISERGKIRSRRITGACRRHQNQIAQAVKRARERAAAVRERHARARARRPRRPWRPRRSGPGALAVPEAILLKDVEGVGERGEVIDVSKGYLRNFLIPRKLAQPATKGAIQAAQRKAEAATRAKEQAVTRSQEHADLLNRTVLTISQQAGDDGRLFGSVTTQDIAEAIREARGIAVDRRKIHLEEPIRHVGTYMVVVELNDGVTSTVKTIVSES
jgi:large subunit ribosomal protein L9